MRIKEDAHDYRYFPDPDLLPLKLTDSFIEKIRNNIPELPDERKSRYIRDYNLSNYDASILTSEKETSNYFDNVINSDAELKRYSKIIVNWISTELFAFLKRGNVNINNSPISPKDLGRLIKLIVTDKISGKIAKEVFEEMFNSSISPEDIVEEKGLVQVSDSIEIEKIINDMLDSNKERVVEYKNGRTKLLGYFVGQVMKMSKGKINPKILNKILSKKLSSN
jgi:aspartyl-tRNA(Asn)/glutamyl-tRNA(Gln) amidotransferase subunit B